MLEQLHIEDNEEECGGQPAGKVKKSITQREAGQHMLRGSQRISISRTSRRDSNIVLPKVVFANCTLFSEFIDHRSHN